MWEILQYPFMQRALIAGLMLALLMASLGIFVVLRQMSFFADGLAHASLASVAIGLIFSWSPLLTALSLSIFFALLVYFVEKYWRLSTDTIIGLIFTGGMSLGVLLISLLPGYQPDLMSFLFGNILAIRQVELWYVLLIGFFIMVFVIYNFRSLILWSLDAETAYVSQKPVRFLQLALYVALALAVVLGIKIMGVILVSALLIVPVASAKVVARSLNQLVVFSLIFAQVVTLAGLVLSYYLDLPSGPTVVLFGVLLFILVLGWSLFNKK
ncbi:metal ABC transporter permease [Patescibacteria group bacterium]|nr:metal ABC transporter permease [Patescibacteria group bacterium]